MKHMFFSRFCFCWVLAESSRDLGQHGNGDNVELVQRLELERNVVPEDHRSQRQRRNGTDAPDDHSHPLTTACVDSWSNMAFGKQDRTLNALTRRLKNKWIVLVGDSSMRMLYHLMVGHLVDGWDLWPTIGQGSHHAVSDTEKHFVNQAARFRVDIKVGGRLGVEDFTYEDVRISYVTLRFANSTERDHIALLMEDPPPHSQPKIKPDAVFLGIGAWHMQERSGKISEFKGNLDAAVLAIDTAFNSPSLAILAVTYCVEEEICEESKLSTSPEVQWNAVLKESASRHGATYVDRALMSKCPCTRSTDCSSGLFHPIGVTQVAILNTMLDTLGI